MEATQTTETFEQFMESMRAFRDSMQKLRERQEESARQIEENDRLIQELRKSQEATDKQIEATGEQMKATDKRIGELGNRFGDMVEHLVRPNLVSQFEKLGFTFTKSNGTEIKDREHNLFLEVDAFLENGDKVMAVEIKSKPKNEDIDDHIERMQKLRIYADLHNDKRVYLGAIAGVVFSNSAKTYALKKGFYVIEPSGDTFAITEPTGAYHPHEW